MTYEETINYLYESTPLFQNIGANAYKEGLYNTYVLDEHFEHPHTKYKTIHIAGTVKVPAHTCSQPYFNHADTKQGYIRHLTLLTSVKGFVLMEK